MRRKAVSVIMLTLLLTSMLTLAFNIQRAECSESPPTEWNRTYGGAKWDVAHSVVETSDGGYALAGYTHSFGAGLSDFWLVKTDSSGNVQWNKTYGGGGYDNAYSIVETSDGGYALAGRIESFGSFPADFWLVKTDSSGNVQWSRTYGGAMYDQANSLVETSDGGYALAGYTYSSIAGVKDFWLVKVDSSGSMQWNKTYDGGEYEAANSLVETSDGGYALAGSTDSYGAGGYDFWLVKTDSSGNHEWNRTYGGIWYDWGYSVVETYDGGYALAGSTESFGAGARDFWLVKTDSSGNVQWNKTYGGSNVDWGYSVVETDDGGYALAGSTHPSGAVGYDFWLVKTDSSGNHEWNRTYSGGDDDEAYSIVETSDGGYALAGYTLSFGAGGFDFWLIKVATVHTHDVAVTSLDAPTTAAPGDIVPINVTVTNVGDYPESGNITVYNDTTEIGTESFTLPSGNQETFSFNWTTTGLNPDTYTINATATIALDENPSNNFMTTTIALVVPPVADADGPYFGSEGSPITFDASGSTPNGGTIVLYEWDWNNDSSYDENTTSPLSNHTWFDDYAGTVGLRITDSEGLNDTATASVTVYNVAPTVNAGPDQTVHIIQTVSFVGSFVDSGINDTHTIFWEFGDGTNTTDTLTPTHVYNGTGVYTVTLNVTDDDGAFGVDTLTVTVLDGEFYDVAVTNVVQWFKNPPVTDEAYSTWPINLNVTVENVGNTTVNCTVTVYYDSIPIATQTVTDLVVTEIRTLTLVGDITGLDPGKAAGVFYTLKANATIIDFPDLNLANNEFAYGTVKVRRWGDVDNSDTITILDLKKVKLAYSGIIDEPFADLDGDCNPGPTILDIKLLKLTYSGLLP